MTPHAEQEFFGLDFVGHPYPGIYDSSNLYFKIIQIFKHRFHDLKQSLCTPVIHDGYTLNTVFSDQTVK